MPDPQSPEPTPFEKFQEAARRIFSAKKDVEKADLRRKKEKEAREADKGK